MNVETFWGRLNRILVVLLVVSAIVLVAVWYLPLIRENENLRKEEIALDNDIKQAEIKVRQKRAAIEALRSDPKTVERLAREKLGLAKTGETVVHFEVPATATLPGPSTNRPASQR